MRKYRNKKTVLNGIVMDSLAEARRIQELILLERAGHISDLEYDKKNLRYDISVNGVKICTYTADSRYRKDGEVIVEDVKGFKTAVYRMKRKLMKAVHGIEIFEYTAKGRRR